MDYYKIEEFDGYYRIGGPDAVFAYMVVGAEKAMLIDTTYSYEDLRPAVESISTLPLIIVNTHGHCDHVGGNGHFGNTPCYSKCH